MVLMIDNYDSFTYNLVQYIGELGCRVKVVRNDALECAAIARMKPERIIISPGPGNPSEAGISCAVIEQFAGKIPLLGVCLGHQCIGAVFGGRIVGAQRLMHGKTSDIYHNGKTIFAGLPQPFAATRYHSLLIERASCPACLEVTAWTAMKEIMGVKHRRLPGWGVQFHPESILTVSGKKLLENFLRQ